LIPNPLILYDRILRQTLSFMAPMDIKAWQVCLKLVNTGSPKPAGTPLAIISTTPPTESPSSFILLSSSIISFAFSRSGSLFHFAIIGFGHFISNIFLGFNSVYFSYKAITSIPMVSNTAFARLRRQHGQPFLFRKLFLHLYCLQIVRTS